MKEYTDAEYRLWYDEVLTITIPALIQKSPLKPRYQSSLVVFPSAIFDVKVWYAMSEVPPFKTRRRCAKRIKKDAK
jgi:hypothetical protein